MKHLQKLICYSAVAVSMSCFSACDKDEETPVFNGFPLEIGNQWEYRTTSTTVFHQGSTIVNVYTNRMHVLKDTVLNNETCYIIQYMDSAHEPSSGRYVHGYYAHRTNGLFLIAVDSATSGPMISLKDEEPSFNGLLPPFNKTMQTPLTFTDPTLHLLKYPVALRDSWSSHEFGFDDDTYRRKYFSNESTTTPAGTFNCVKLQILSTVLSSPEHVQYFSNEGLIREEMIRSSRTITGSGIDSVDIRRITELVYKNF